MERKKISLPSGITLSYLEQGEGPENILFIHGNSLGAETFAYQFQSPELKKYHLFAVDLPGHGESSKDKTADARYYNLPGMAIVMHEFISALGLRNLVLAGNSFGGHLIYEMLDAALPVRGIITFGAPPLGVPPAMDKAFLPHPELGFFFTPNLTKEQINNLSKSVTGKDAALICKLIEQSDPVFREKVAASIAVTNFKDELKVVNTSSLPFAILHGENDLFINGDYYKTYISRKIWRNSVQVIKNAGHCPQLDQPGAFNKILTDFISA
ncbi:MAG: alpha/beta fold hydrolase [Bacteroidia bacterium]